jgi:hypothetical protein
LELPALLLALPALLLALPPLFALPLLAVPPAPPPLSLELQA